MSLSAVRTVSLGLYPGRREEAFPLLSVKDQKREQINRFFTERCGIDRNEVDKRSRKTSNCSCYTHKKEVKPCSEKRI